MLVKFLEKVKLKVFWEERNTEVLSFYASGTIANLEDPVGKELVERGIVIQIPDKGYGASIDGLGK